MLRKYLVMFITLINLGPSFLSLKAATSNPRDPAAFDTRIMDINLSISPGQSYYIHELGKSLRSEQIKIAYYPSFRCPQNGHGLYGVSIRDSATKTWHFSRNPGYGFYDLKDLSFDAIKIDLQSNVSYTMVCRMIADIISQDVPDPIIEEFAGVISHEGGFQYRIKVPMQFAYTATLFRVEIPGYCGGLEVKEAGVATDRGFVTAKLVDGSKGLFAFSDPMLLDHIVVTLNGPLAQACDLPVYVSVPDDSQG